MRVVYEIYERIQHLHNNCPTETLIPAHQRYQVRKNDKPRTHAAKIASDMLHLGSSSDDELIDEVVPDDLPNSYTKSGYREREYSRPVENMLAKLDDTEFMVSSSSEDEDIMSYYRNLQAKADHSRISVREFNARPSLPHRVRSTYPDSDEAENELLSDTPVLGSTSRLSLHDYVYGEDDECDEDIDDAIPDLLQNKSIVDSMLHRRNRYGRSQRTPQTIVNTTGYYRSPDTSSSSSSSLTSMRSRAQQKNTMITTPYPHRLQSGGSTNLGLEGTDHIEHSRQEKFLSEIPQHGYVVDVVAARPCQNDTTTTECDDKQSGILPEDLEKEFDFDGPYVKKSE